MARVAAADALPKLLKKLLADRSKYQAAADKALARVAQIDGIFADAGISVGGSAVKAARRGAPKAGKRGGRRKRRAFAVSGEQSVLDFVKKAGTPSTAEVNAHWKKEGRGGKADNTLSKLVSAKKLKRVKDDSVRGSRYAIA